MMLVFIFQSSCGSAYAEPAEFTQNICLITFLKAPLQNAPELTAEGVWWGTFLTQRSVLPSFVGYSGSLLGRGCVRGVISYQLIFLIIEASPLATRMLECSLCGHSHLTPLSAVRSGLRVNLMCLIFQVKKIRQAYSFQHLDIPGVPGNVWLLSCAGYCPVWMQSKGCTAPKPSSTFPT